jgi:hypothetical protein
MTMEDIRKFAIGKMQPAHSGELTSEGAEKLNELTEDMMSGACGVFLWVRLVVDELIEGLCEGDSIDQLRELFSTIPSELAEMYARAIRFSPLFPSTSLLLLISMKPDNK